MHAYMRAYGVMCDVQLQEDRGWASVCLVVLNAWACDCFRGSRCAEWEEGCVLCKNSLILFLIMLAFLKPSFQIYFFPSNPLLFLINAVKPPLLVRKEKKLHHLDNCGSAYLYIYLFPPPDYFRNANWLCQNNYGDCTCNSHTHCDGIRDSELYIMAFHFHIAWFKLLSFSAG